MRTLNDYFLTSAIPDVSASSSTFVNVPDGGRIIKIFAHNKAVSYTHLTLPTILLV